MILYISKFPLIFILLILCVTNVNSTKTKSKSVNVLKTKIGNVNPKNLPEPKTNHKNPPEPATNHKIIIEPTDSNICFTSDQALIKYCKSLETSPTTATPTAIATTQSPVPVSCPTSTPTATNALIVLDPCTDPILSSTVGQIAAAISANNPLVYGFYTGYAVELANLYLDQPNVFTYASTADKSLYQLFAGYSYPRYQEIVSVYTTFCSPV